MVKQIDVIFDKLSWILFTMGNTAIRRSKLGRYLIDRVSVDTRSTHDRSRSILGLQSVDLAVDSRSIVGGHSVETRSIVVPEVSRPI